MVATEKKTVKSLGCWKKDDQKNFNRSNDSICSKDGPSDPKDVQQMTPQQEEYYYQKLKQYPYLQRHTVPLQPLQDWSSKKWAEELQQHKSATAELLYSLQIPHTDVTDCAHHDETLDLEAGESTSITTSKGVKHAALADTVLDRVGKGLTKEQWRSVAKFQQTNAFHDTRGEKEYYLSPETQLNVIFRREFPMGVNADALSLHNRWAFAVKHSGSAVVRHHESPIVDYLVWGAVVCLLLAAVIFLSVLMADDKLWCPSCTSATASSHEVNTRTKDRGTVASILSALTFSLIINAALDKFGKIEPSTSTVFVGMLLGGTWGFILDNMLGSDEGFREYLSDPSEGMKYALGSVASARYGRYLVTILYDMFFSVILFKHVYSKLVSSPGLSRPGREWLANGFSSFLISFITYQVYANMTRFEWAYPSGAEDVTNQWISGSTMILAAITMNMVYLTSETRLQIGEPGINDPNNKLLVTIVTFALLWGLQNFEVIDPSISQGTVEGASAGHDHLQRKLQQPSGDDTSPLKNVCATIENWHYGLLLFACLTMGCLGCVIFVTSQQTFTELMRSLTCGRVRVRAGTDVDGTEKGTSPSSQLRERWWAKITLFVLSCSAVLVILLFFTFVPLWSSDEPRVETCTSRLTVVAGNL
jgi:hypothetical protein